MTSTVIARSIAPAEGVSPAAVACPAGMGCAAPVGHLAFRAVFDRVAGTRAAPLASPASRGAPFEPRGASPACRGDSRLDGAEGRGPLDPASEDADDGPVARPRRHLANASETCARPLPSVVYPPAPVTPSTGADRAIAIDVARAAPSLEHLMTAFVRRVAWSGDGRRGSARIEIGAGSLAGATLVVHADSGRVRVHLDVPPGVDAGAWRDRIARSLASRRIPADEIDVA